MPELTGLTPEDHRRILLDYVGEDGTLEDVGAAHLSIFRPGEQTLVVEFGELSAIRSSPGGLPWAAGLARKRNVATLTIAAHGATWYRDSQLHDHFDRLTDVGLFDDYDSVIFAGGGMGAYGAGAFSVAAPGATVFLVQPYATLDREIAPWEERFRSARRLAFGPRYGNAAQMIDAAGQVYVVTDPTRPLDAMHASLFQGPHVVRLPARYGGPDIWGQLRSLGVLDRLVAGAATGLSPLRFAQLWRGRRSDPAWLARVLRELEQRDRPWLTAIWAGAMLRRADSPIARRRLNAALSQLEAEGRDRPAGLMPQPIERPDRLLLAGE